MRKKNKLFPAATPTQPSPPLSTQLRSYAEKGLPCARTNQLALIFDGGGEAGIGAYFIFWIIQCAAIL